MQRTIYFVDKALVLTDEPVEIPNYYRLASSELSIAKVLKIFETTNTIVVLDKRIEAVYERFQSEFKCIKAAGGIVDNERGESLMIFCYNRWGLPKGHVDSGESDAECAVREIAEETGVTDAKIVRFLCNTYHAYGVYGEWELKRTAWYALTALSMPPKPQKEEDIVEAKWCSPAEVERNLSRSYATIRQVFKIKQEES